MSDRGLAEFHLRLISRIIDMSNYPFTRMMMEKDMSSTDYVELMNLLDDLNNLYHSQKEDGLLDYSSLLIHFAGMLNEKLQPTETINALKQEGYYEKLMSEFITILQREENKNKRR